MKRKLLCSALLSLSLAMVLTACGGGSGSSGSANNPTPVTTTRQATQAASVVSTASGSLASGAVSQMYQMINLGMSLIYGTPSKPVTKLSSHRFRNANPEMVKLGNSLQKLTASRAVAKVASALKARAAVSAPSGGTLNCSYGGTLSYNGTADSETGNVDMTFTFDGCREYAQQADGILKIKGTVSTTPSSAGIDLTETLGSGSDALAIRNFSDNSFSTVVWRYNYNGSLTALVNYSSTASDQTGEQKVTATGYTEIIDKSAGNAWRFDLNSFDATDNYTFSYNNNSYHGQSSTTFDGGIKSTYTPGAADSQATVFETLLNNFVDRWDDSWTRDQNGNENGTSKEDVNGTVTVNSTPACINGTFQVVTTERITDNYAYDASTWTWTDNYTAGELAINGAVITYNADGSLMLTVNGESTNYDSWDAMVATAGDTCDFSVFSWGD